MRKMFLKRDWKNIKDVFLDNNEVLLNDNYKDFKIELVYSPAVDVPFTFYDQNGGSHSVFISLMFRSESSRGETRRCRRSSPRRDSSSSRRRCSCRRVPAS